MHEAHRGHCRGEVEQARVVALIRTSPATVLTIEAVAGVSRCPAAKVLGTNLNRSESCLGIRRSLHCKIWNRPMSAEGLGCANTPAPAAHVETYRRNCASWSRMMLRARRSMLCWRIVFSTFLRCMSFYTARVKRGKSQTEQMLSALPERWGDRPASL